MWFPWMDKGEGEEDPRFEKNKVIDNVFIGDKWTIVDVAGLEKVRQTWSSFDKFFFEKYPEECRKVYPQFYMRTEEYLYNVMGQEPSGHPPGGELPRCSDELSEAQQLCPVSEEEKTGIGNVSEPVR